MDVEASNQCLPGICMGVMSLCYKVQYVFLDQKGPVQTMTPIRVGFRGEGGGGGHFD